MEPTTNNPSVITRLFEAAGVKRVVFVDDRFCISATVVQEKVDELEYDQLQACGAFAEIDFGAADELITREIIRKRVSTATQSEIDTFFDLLHPEHDSAKDKSATEHFHRFVSPSADVVSLSLKRWERHKTRLLLEADSTPTIFIFDDDFTLEGYGSEHGRRLIEETHSANPKYKFVYALLTHNAPDDAAEESLQREIAKKSPDLGNYLIVISKSRLSDNIDRFADRMKSFLLYRLFNVLTHRLSKETAAASEQAIKKLDNLGIQSFERIVLSSSRAEGAWSPDTLVRVIGVYQQQIVKSTIRKDEEIHRLVREIHPICDVMTASMSAAVPTNAWKLQHDEIYEPAESVNAVHLPIACGDIFQSPDGRKYIVLAQPCDLVVRSAGYRRDEERDRRQFVTLATIRKVDSKLKKSPLPEHECELLYFVDVDRWSVRLNETYHVPVWLLDLAVLNTQGECSIASTTTASPLLVEPWLNRLPVLLDRAKSIVSAYAKVGDKSLDLPDLLQSYCRLPLGSPFQVLAEVTPPDWRLTFQLTRTSRVAEAHATGVLIAYSAFLSRLAHPHELTREHKIAE